MGGDLSMVENIADGVDGGLFERKKTSSEERPKDNNTGLDNGGKFVGVGANCQRGQFEWLVLLVGREKF